MNEKIIKVIEALSTKSETASNAHEAMQFAQAALNLANAVSTLSGAEIHRRKSQ